VEQVEIPNTGGTVSRVGLGTWAIGGWMWGGTDEGEALAAVRSALDHGITLIDTAPVYGFGRSEEIVGRALEESGKRDDVVLATKLGLSWRGGRIYRDSSPARVRQEIEDSLRRLRTDHIDIYQVHWPDSTHPYQETARALQRLRDQGKIRAIGVSNFSVEQIGAFSQGAVIDTLQPPYNLFERETERELLPYAKAHGIATLTYGAICRGLLSGRMTPDTTFTGDDLRLHDPKFRPPLYKHYLAAVARLDRFAQERYGRRVIHLAVRWVLDTGAHVALWGMRRPEQVAPVDMVMGWRLDQTALAEIDDILRETVPEAPGPGFRAP
jgi:aryl-alcohol dehydrogenase-like predicted oxidoreductase